MKPVRFHLYVTCFSSTPPWCLQDLKLKLNNFATLYLEVDYFLINITWYLESLFDMQMQLFWFRTFVLFCFILSGVSILFIWCIFSVIATSHIWDLLYLFYTFLISLLMFISPTFVLHQWFHFLSYKILKIPSNYHFNTSITFSYFFLILPTS